MDAIYAAALDTVPIYVVLSNPSEAAEWSSLLKLAQEKGRGWAIPPHTALDLATMTNCTTADLTSRIQAMGLPRKCLVGVSWKNNQRQWGHLKKFHALREVGARGCVAAWVLDAESRPLRQFHFSEIFSRRQLVLLRNSSDLGQTGLQHPSRITTADPECLALASSVHRLPVPDPIAYWGLQENDFWLYDTRLVAEFVEHATNRGERPFVAALMQSKSVSEQLIWYTFLWSRRQLRLGSAKHPRVHTAMSRLLPGSETGPDRASYRFVAATPEGVRPCGLSLSEQQTSLWDHQHHKSSSAVNCSCLGAHLFALGQAGLRGEYLFPFKWTPVQAKSHLRLREPGCLRALRVHIPWCLSTLCDAAYRDPEKSLREFGRSPMWGQMEVAAERKRRGSFQSEWFEKHDLQSLLLMQTTANDAEGELPDLAAVSLFDGCTADTLAPSCACPTLPRDTPAAVSTADVVVSFCSKAPLAFMDDVAGTLAHRGIALRRVLVASKCDHASVLPPLPSSSSSSRPSYSVKEVENVGRNDHTYATAIAESYEDLADITFFVKDSYTKRAYNPFDDMLRDAQTHGFGCGSAFLWYPIDNVRELDAYNTKHDQSRHRKHAADDKMGTAAGERSKASHGTAFLREDLASPLAVWGQYFALGRPPLPAGSLLPICFRGVFAASARALRRVPHADWLRVASMMSRGDNIIESHLMERSWAYWLLPSSPWFNMSKDIPPVTYLACPNRTRSEPLGNAADWRYAIERGAWKAWERYRRAWGLHGANRRVHARGHHALTSGNLPATSTASKAAGGLLTAASSIEAPALRHKPAVVQATGRRLVDMVEILRKQTGFQGGIRDVLELASNRLLKEPLRGRPLSEVAEACLKVLGT